MKKAFVFILIAGLFLTVSCGRQYAKGRYIDSDTIIIRSDNFVDTDLNIIAKHLADSMLDHSILAVQDEPPVVLVSKITNSTDEHIDMQSLTEKIQVILQESGKIKLINAKLRDTIQGEHEYQEAGFIDPETAKSRGKQIGAEYLISGNISSIKQPVGRQEIVYYKATLELTDIESNVISWMDDVEIKKQFRKKFTGF